METPKNEKVFTDKHYDFLKKVKMKIIEAIYEDDKLADYLTLKGGTLLDMVWGISGRPSKDIDFSIDRNIAREEIDEIGDYLEDILARKFQQGIEGVSYELFGFRFKERPSNLDDNIRIFWGGYKVEFQIKDEKTKQQAMLGTTHKKGKENLSSVFTIDFSPVEICDEYKEEQELETVLVYIYSPIMVVCEKIRAICQQNPKYAEVFGKKSMPRKPRTRDFYDIHRIMDYFGLDVILPENIELLRLMFGIKRVPLEFLGEVKEFSEFHASEFETVLNTLPQGEATFPNFQEYF